MEELLADFPELGFWRYDCCRFGAAWRKRTRVLTNTSLKGLSQLCTGGHEHILLQGRSRAHGMSWTKVAESYPPRVCQRLAAAVLAGVPRKSPSVSACVRDGAQRIGEAANPGPPSRQRDQARDGSLFDVELVEAATAALRVKVWDSFTDWLRRELSEKTVVSLFKCPPLLALVLRDYADELYKIGASLGHYRQLLAHVQKVVPLVRPHLKVAWEMATRWEALQPVVHRTPLPEALLRAMVGVALALKWRRWAAVTLAAFYMIARPGEMLRAKRKHVLTPVDLLDDGHAWLYLRIEKPKSRRKATKVQHIKMNEPGVLGFIQALWQTLPQDELLYPGSPGVYRRRWDKVLQIQEIPVALKITPASLRAGGAIAAFHKGSSVNDLLWRMRLKSLTTLEHYLQEMAAVSLLPTLKPTVRRRILSAGSICQAVIGGWTQ